VLILGLVSIAILLPVLGAALLSPRWLGPLLALPLSWAVIRFGMPLIDRVFGALWLVRIYAFNLQQARRAVAGLDERLELLSRHISQSANDAPDEVLVIGHSTGVQLAASLLARTLARDPELARRSRVSLLTLGGSIPMLGWQPEAKWFRDEIAALSQNKDIDWLDFTTTQDGATFAMLDPVQLLGLQPSADGPRPKVLSTKLFEMFTPETFARIRRDWRLVHFQYLMAFEKSGDYDFFAMVAGPWRLARRFAHRKPAKPLAKFKLRIFRR
jgi:pimeloyl-ACP methyl ester carboxylesterase